ncbi:MULTISPECIES: DMT family transporter [Thioclava]|uniref:DMT family transporter n=1 Tax=Thioclava TaxID=285107 RepID=UPI000C4D425F|nr:DMT family transporter [Thioclava electrotropha]MAQ38074.1 EamA family transporter [Thioclava sp.]
MTPEPTDHDNLRGSMLMILAMAGFALEDMFIKMLAGDWPVGQILAAVGLGGATIFAVLAKLKGERIFTRSLLSSALWLRNLGEIVGTGFFVSAVAFTPLAQATAIHQATPLATTLGAAIFLKERVGWRRLSAILIGFLGVLVVIRPGTDEFSMLSLLAVGAVIGLSMRDVTTRRVPRDVTSLQVATLGFFCVLPLGLVLLAVLPEPIVTPEPMDWLYLAGALAIGPVGYYALIASVRLGEIAVIMPFRYSRLAFAVVISTLVFAEPPDRWTLIGGAVIVGSGLYALWRQAKLRREGRR